MNTAELRRFFLVENLFTAGSLEHAYPETNRTILGSAVPAAALIEPATSSHALDADFFLQRRELGAINLLSVVHTR